MKFISINIIAYLYFINYCYLNIVSSVSDVDYNSIEKLHQQWFRNKRNENSKDLSLVTLSSTSCNIGLLECKEDEVCKVTETSSTVGVCFCKDGWRRKSDGNCEKVLKENKKLCEVGLLNCSENEKCVPINKRTKHGVCECKDDYHLVDGSCIIKSGFNNNTRLNSTQSVKNETTEPYSAHAYNLSTSTTLVPGLSSSIVQTTIDVALTTKSSVVEKIIVNVNNKTILLPEGANCYEDWTTLSAYAIGDSGSKYKYAWSLLTKPESKEEGSIRNTNTPTISLSNLVEGVYIFKVSVSAENAYGKATGNITVIPAQHTNRPPVAVIVPSSQTVKLPNSVVIFDASGSIDDDKVTSFHWELTMGPLGYKLKEVTGPTLQLEDPLPGNYTIMLKVWDKEGLEGNTTASLIVVKETDYPPTANAGGDKIIYLPQTEITLNGNSSSDDHGIIEWEWTKGPEDSGNAVDMQDTRTPNLRLGNLEEGHYHFILKVIDTAKQSATSAAHVYVHSAEDNILEANAGANETIIIPNSSSTLDGSKSKGISSQTHYLWKQISGPKIAHLIPNDNVKVNASELTRGIFVFQLTIWNDDPTKNSSSNVTLNVVQDKNAPPVAHAGGDFSVTLPVSVVLVNGTSSTDDVGITKWLWQRDDASLAAGTVIKTSDHSPVLLFTNVVTGRYVWNLTVWDDQGSSSSDSVSIIVKEGPNYLNQVEILLGVGIENLSVSQVNNLIQKLQLLLQSASSDVTFDVQKIQGRPLSGTVRLVLLGFRKGKVIPGTSLVQQLRSKTMLNSKAKILDLPIMSIDTIVCQNDCSGHGECIPATRECRCQSWWMESSFRRRFGDGVPNCDWSVIYVFVGAIGSSLLIGLCIWMTIVILIKNLKKLKHHKSRNPRYSLLDGHDESVKVKTRIPGSLLDSGSDSESESEILFDTRKSRLKNDKIKNGHIKLQRIRT